MKKKKYVRPEMAVIAIDACSILTVSNGIKVEYGRGDGNTGDDEEWVDAG